MLNSSPVVAMPKSKGILPSKVFKFFYTNVPMPPTERVLSITSPLEMTLTWGKKQLF